MGSREEEDAVVCGREFFSENFFVKNFFAEQIFARSNLRTRRHCPRKRGRNELFALDGTSLTAEGRRTERRARTRD